MADYPDVEISFASTREADGGLLVAYSPNGTIFSQTHYDNSWFVFQLVHPYISEADKTAIEAFYELQKSNAFDLRPYPKDGVNYVNCRFLPQGVQSQRIRGQYWTVTSTFRGEKE